MMEISSVENLVKLLGITKYEIKKDELSCLCLNPNHNDNSLGNFYINLKSGFYNCFSCHYKGNIISLFYSRNKSYTESIALWNSIRLDRGVEFNRPLQPLSKYQLLPYLDNPISQYAIERIGDVRVLEEYNVRSDNEGNPVFFTQRIRGRYDSIWTRVGGKYYLLEPDDAKKHGVLFGEHLPPTDYTILVEGTFDALTTRKILGYKAVSGFGTQLTALQISRLRKMNNLVIFMDGDIPGRNARDKIINQLWGKSDLYVMGGYKKDPDELGEEMCKYFANKKHIIEYRMLK